MAEENENVDRVPEADDPMWRRTFDHAMEIWITPEVIRRQTAGLIPRPYHFMAGQVIFHADGRPYEVRLNNEVRAIGNVKLKQYAVPKNAGDPVFLHEVENFKSFRLPDDEDPNCGHLTIIRLGDQWTLLFDFVYNRGIAAEHLSAARQFLAAAQQALASKSLRVFVDTCFSAAELSAKALLLVTPLPGLDGNMHHRRIHAQFNYQAKLGNVDLAHKNAFNRLASLRYPARYLDESLAISVDEADALVNAVKESLDFVSKRVRREI